LPTVTSGERHQDPHWPRRSIPHHDPHRRLLEAVEGRDDVVSPGGDARELKLTALIRCRRLHRLARRVLELDACRRQDGARLIGNRA